jgi:hypothetical protein
VNYVARYTGTFTDWLTLSAAYGRHQVRQQPTYNSLVNEPLVQDARSGTAVTISRQTVAAGTTFPFILKREFYRGDADLYFRCSATTTSAPATTTKRRRS